MRPLTDLCWLLFSLAAFILPSNAVMASIRCPIAGCNWENTFKRVLAHIRSFHRPDDCPEAFIQEHGLSKCPKCSQWFLKIHQHTSRCCSSSICVDHTQTSSQEPAKASTHPDKSSAGVELEANFQSDREAEAWRLIDSLTTEAILDWMPPRTVQNVTPGL